MLDEHVRFLVCPHCREALARAGGSLRCRQGHTFDVAAQGYVSLLAGRGRTVPGDNADMVDARARFLACGHFLPIADALAEAGSRELARARRTSYGAAGTDRCVVDLGAGTGYYLDHVGERLRAQEGGPHGLIAVDVSKYAMRRAARLHPRVGAVVADVRHGLPVAGGSAALVIGAFAPRAPAEIARVLAVEGAFVAVLPRGEHLAELRETLGLLTVDPEKRERAERKLGAALDPVDERRVSYALRLDRDTVRDLVRMGPTAWHQRPEETEERLLHLPDPVDVSVAVSVLTYRRGHRE